MYAQNEPTNSKYKLKKDRYSVGHTLVRVAVFQ